MEMVRKRVKNMRRKNGSGEEEAIVEERWKNGLQLQRCIEDSEKETTKGHCLGGVYIYMPLEFDLTTGKPNFTCM